MSPQNDGNDTAKGIQQMCVIVGSACALTFVALFVLRSIGWL